MTSSNISIREAKPEDIPQVYHLIRELAEFERALPEVENTVEQLRADGFGKHPLYGLYVAQQQTDLIGMALYYYRYSTWKGKTLYLEDLYVKPDFRGLGIGQRLLEKLARKALDENCQRMQWQVLDWNESAIAFYRQLGADFDAEWINVFLDGQQLAHLAS